MIFGRPAGGMNLEDASKLRIGHSVCTFSLSVQNDGGPHVEAVFDGSRASGGPGAVNVL